MSQRLITSHVRDEGYKWPLLVSTLGHVLLFLFFLFAVEIFPAGQPLVIGTGAGGGQGRHFVTVGLSGELSGGVGMYKPALTPRPAAVPPPARKERKSTNSEKNEDVFVQKTPRKAKKPSPASQSKGSREAMASGLIPQEAEPGTGQPGHHSAGSGGGFGPGQGVTIGPGTGQGVMDSWYVRQVEQRVGQNWLKTSLGQLGRPVQTIASFQILPHGEIENVQIEKTSGIRSVDLAAERAIRASNPLPPLPHEFRRGKVKFVAHFEYPPR